LRVPHDFPPALGPTLELLQLLWRVDHALQRRSKRMARELGVTGPQRLALRLIGRFPGLPAGELAALLHVHPSTLSGVLSRLERGGWLQRRVDPRDGRRALFGLTERGRALDADDPLTIEAAVERALAAATEAERTALRAALGRLAEELEAGGAGGETAARTGEARQEARKKG
jgi:MarR family transcriptional regulator, organic hydroperoxide resistance regulator